MSSGNQGVSGLTSGFMGGTSGGTPIPNRGRKAGQVVFSVEAVEVLKKWDILRLERNMKREERRKAGEVGVSDDEGDELTPYMMVVPSGNTAEGAEGAEGPSSDPIAPAVVSAEPATTFLFGDDAAEKNLFQANDSSIPAAIFSLAKNGISPRLTMFTPDSLDLIRSGNAKTTKHGTGETTRVMVIDVKDFAEEDTLDLGAWTTCYNTFLTFMEAAAGFRTYQGFARHFNQMLSDPDLASWFPAYRAFDRRIRSQFFTRPCIIDVNHFEYRSALQSAKNSVLMARHSSGSSAGHSSGSGAGHYSGSGAGSAHGRGGSGGRDRDSKPYEKNASFRKRPLLCFRCGRVGHGALACDATEPSKHGREFTISASREGLFRLGDNRPVCMGFNCGKCDVTSRQHALHICSLCGDAHHGAVNCTRN